MEDLVVITALANAGLLFQYRGHALLADALQRSDQLPFTGLPENIWKTMLAGESPFSQVDALLFSHLHPDHFSESMTQQYLQRHPDTRLFLPDDASLTGREDGSAPAKVIRITGENALTPYPVGEDITVRAFSSLHLDEKYHNTPHFCYVLSFGEKNVLLTGDIDYTCETLSQIADIPLKAAFITPLFFRALNAHRFFRGQLMPQTLFVNHIPDASEDQFGVRHMVQRDLASRHADSPVFACTQINQKFFL